MNEITTKKDVNEILADSKSLTQYLEDVYEVEKNLYSVYQAKQRMEVIINQSGQERVMERKCPSLLHIGNILLTVAALYCGGRILLSEGMWTAIFIVFTIGAVWWLAENVKSYVHQKKAYDENVKAVAADRKRVQEELESLPEKRQILAECTRSVEESQQLLDNYYACNKLTIEALGEPKLGNIDFYLKRPAGASFWTYDYLIRPTIKDGKKTGELEIRDGVLRGRKFYWHHRKVNTSRSVVTTKLNKTIRPVKKDIVFTGKLYFESISKRQMDQLIWLLNSGNEKLGLKLGGAKPLGFGSISCQVQCVQERVIRLKNGNLNYELMELPVDGITYESAGFSSTVKKEFYKIAGLETIPENVEITYPKTIEQKGQPLTEGFKWFVNNHKTLSGGGMRGRNNVRIETVLPSILDEDVSMEYNLPSQTSRGGAKGFNGGSGKTSGNGRNRGNSQGNFRKNNQRGRH